MATGGTGDVLAGVTGSLLARHGALLAATAAAVVHGRAGDIAAERCGEEGMTAGDLAEALPDGDRGGARGAARGWAIRELVSHGEAETAEVAREIAAGFRGGEVVLLTGELGAGKTAFVRGLARGLGADPDEVASPTFVLLTAYPGRLTLHHADLYRLRGDGDERELGLEELPGPEGRAGRRVGGAAARPAVARGRARRASSHAGDDERLIRIEEAA